MHNHTLTGNMRKPTKTPTPTSTWIAELQAEVHKLRAENQQLKYELEEANLKLRKTNDDLSWANYGRAQNGTF